VVSRAAPMGNAVPLGNNAATGGGGMLSDQENHRLAEIELHLRLSDPPFFARMSQVRRPWYRRWLSRR
jgi:hypothetical protein